MVKGRIESHPILSIEDRREISFKFNGKKVVGVEGDVISSALIAAGFDIFSYHQKDNAPQGIFCANGQCAQCTVIVDGVPQKACMTPLRPIKEKEGCMTGSSTVLSAGAGSMTSGAIRAAMNRAAAIRPSNPAPKMRRILDTSGISFLCGSRPLPAIARRGALLQSFYSVLAVTDPAASALFTCSAKTLAFMYPTTS